MELPKNKKSDGGIFGSIKDKLGFSRGREEHEEHDDFDQNYDEFDVGDDYDNYDKHPYEGNHADQAYRATAYNDPMHAPLVSIDDVRASTQIPESLTRDPLASRPAPSSVSTYVDQSNVYENPVSTQLPYERGYDRGIEEPISDISSALSSGSVAFDPYEAYAGAGYTPTRSLHVIKPIAYREVERVSKALKSGDAVVLSFRNTPDQLMKRILDFSFGVSSALDASVECIADKVFVITRGAALSEQEKMQLRDQGVL